MNKLTIEPSIIELRFPKTIEQLNSQVFKRYHEFRKEFNEAQMDGLGNAGMLKSSHLKAFEVIMYKYLPSFRARVNSPMWADSDEVPMLFTTRKELANLINCGRRTVYNLLARLAAAGLISVEEQTSGRRTGYAITPNLFFTLGTKEFRPEVVVLTEAVSVLQSTGTWQKLPDLNNLKNFNNKDKAELPLFDTKENTKEFYQRIEQTEPCGAESQITGAEMLENTKEFWAGEKNEAVDNSIEAIANQRATSKRDKFFGKNGAVVANTAKMVQKPIQAHEKNKMVDDFWKYARDLFYPNKEYEKQIEQNIKNLIYTDVFGGFNGHENYNEWQTFALMRHAEADLIARNNEKYDREAFFPTSFFSKNYLTRGGFLSAHVWTKKERKKYNELQHKELLQKAKESILCGKIPAHKKATITEPKALADYWQMKIARNTGNSDIVQQFLVFISQTNITRAWTATATAKTILTES